MAGAQSSTLEFDRLSRAYGRIQALREASFEVHAGEIFGFVGSNGAGKTTTMRIALGVLAADSGQVRWRGVPLDLEARRRVGYMPEERGLYPKMKVAAQLIYLGRLHGMSAADAQAAMLSWTQRLGLAARRDDEVQKLSQGNQQRVQLAAALMHTPDVLVLDEPFSGLDPVAVDVMSDVLREQSDSGVPVVFSSHQLALVEGLCDRVGIIRNGAMVAVGSIDELRKAGAPRWVVDAPSTAPGWVEEIPGVVTVGVSGSRTTVEVRDPAPGAEQAVLEAAMRAGRVREFAQVKPSLTELYRDVVSQDDAEPAQNPQQPATRRRFSPWRRGKDAA